MSKILVIEDDLQLAEIIKDYFEMAGHEVTCAEDGAAGIAYFDRLGADLVILDVMMPFLDGWSVCRRIRKKSDCYIIFLSARTEEEDKLMGFDIGADEYITKPFSPKVLVARATALLKRQSSIIREEDVIKQNRLIIQPAFHSVKLDGKELDLTVKEFELLLVLSRNPGRVLKREYLIDSVWGIDYFGDGRVLDTNIKTLRKKLGTHAGMIKTVIGIGYKLEDSHEVIDE
ncbi:MAG: response regulator transcription factor [Firmicutes bacterium]|nr:response regulator transcription factor [Bacillota bacterium]